MLVLRFFEKYIYITFSRSLNCMDLLARCFVYYIMILSRHEVNYFQIEKKQMIKLQLHRYLLNLIGYK